MPLKPETECYDCFVRGFSDFVKRAGLDRNERDRLVSVVHEALDAGLTPPLAGREAWNRLRSISRVGEDVFLHEKKRITEQLLLRYDVMKEALLKLDSPESAALAAGVWANIIDAGQGGATPDADLLLSVLFKPLAIDRTQLFLKLLHRSEMLLILGDNAGETVLDRLFLDVSSFSGKKYYMTRALPVMNDATPRDARSAGLHRVSEIVSSGSDVPAVIPDLLRGKARELFLSADIILAKGQGNFEGLYGLADQRIFHSFVVKCPVIARASGVETGQGVFSRFTDMGDRDANL